MRTDMMREAFIDQAILPLCDFIHLLAHLPEQNQYTREMKGLVIQYLHELYTYEPVED